MIKHFFIIVLLVQFFAVSIHAQQKKIKPPPPPVDINFDNKCYRIKHTNFSTRIKNYPFNKASQIQFVSFENNTDSNTVLNLRRSDGTIIDPEEKIYAIYTDSLPRINDTICYSKLLEVKSLTFSQVQKLTDIIYNYGFRKNVPYRVIGHGCFEPRNAILFLDNNGKVFEFIEVCFHCSETKSSNDSFSIGEMCDQKMSLLRSLFKDTGIKHGVITE